MAHAEQRVQTNMSLPMFADQGPADWIRGIAESQDKDCFGKLFAHFAPRLKSFHRRSGASDIVAEDLAQETLMIVWRKAHLYDPSKAAPAAWIYTISRNRMIDMIRREKNPDNYPLDEGQETSITPERELCAKQTGRQLEAAIAVLSPGQVSLLRLSFFNGMSHSDISRKLGIPLGTIKSRLRSAVTRLRTELHQAM
jgi:RNA polymerase sigma-70 factor (ECF subfamily)